MPANSAPPAPAASPFTGQERELIQTTLIERYARLVPLQDVEVELLVRPGDPAPLACPAVYWQDGTAEFVVARVPTPAGPVFRPQFFYAEGDALEAFGTGHDAYGNLGDCLVTLLQVQAAHAAERRAPAGARAPQPKPTGDDDYDGPLVI